MTNEAFKKGDETLEIVFGTLQNLIRQPPSASTDTQRVALVVIRTVARTHYNVRPA
jgi:hypothetical protein